MLTVKLPQRMYAAAPMTKGITDNFIKIELLTLTGPECQYLPMKHVKHISLQFQTIKKNQLKKKKKKKKPLYTNKGSLGQELAIFLK